MNPGARREDVVLFAAALVYFCLIHVWAPQSPLGIERWFPKEIAVAIVFASAVAVPAWSRLQGQRILLTPLVALFALLCWLNCVAIEKWEKGESRSSNHARASNPALPHLSTRWTQCHLPLVACGIALLGVIAAASSTVFAAPAAHGQPLSRLHCIGAAVPGHSIDRNSTASISASPQMQLCSRRSSLSQSCADGS